jgi:hypothetical protein
MQTNGGVSAALVHEGVSVRSRLGCVSTRYARYLVSLVPLTCPVRL